MRKKLTAVLPAAAMFAYALAGTTGIAQNVYAADEEETLTVWCWDPTFNVYAMKQAEAAYQKLSLIHILSRVAGLFSRRGYNIDSLTVGETQDKRHSRMTVVAEGEPEVLEQIEKQLAKLVDCLLYTSYGICCRKVKGIP